MATATDVVRAVVASNTLLHDNISTDNGATLKSIGSSILAYTPYMNAFIDTLVNRILFQEVHTSVYENPLRLFKGAAIPYGTDVQDSIANPAVATPYDATAMSDILTPQNPDVKTVYYRRNRQDKYAVTIYDEQLKGAFTEPDAFNRFVQMILNTLTSGDNIDEYELMRSLLTSALNDNNINNTSITTTNNDSKAYAEDIIIKARSKFLEFQFPSTKHNCYKKMADARGVQNPTELKTWTTPDRIAVIMRADIAALTDVDVLAKAFNMSKAEFLGRQVIVDNFGDGKIASKTLAVVCDETAIRTHDNMFKMANTEYNAATLSRKYYLHHWETMAYSPLANAHAFVAA